MVRQTEMGCLVVNGNSDTIVLDRSTLTHMAQRVTQNMDDTSTRASCSHHICFGDNDRWLIEDGICWK